MAIFTYNFEKKCSQYWLEKELKANAELVIGVHAVNIVNGTQTRVMMKDDLMTYPGQYEVLAAAVTAHIWKEDPSDIRLPLMTLVENERIPEEGIELTYRMYPMVFEIPEGTNGGLPYEFPIVFPCTVATLGATIDLSTAMIGDSMAYDVPSEITVGALAADVAQGDITGYINPESRGYIYKGMDIIIGSTVQGRIYDWEGDYGFKLFGAFDAAYTAGTAVKVRFRTVDKYLVTAAPLQLWISRDTDRAAIVPKNTPQKFYYWNDTGTAKKVQICFEFYT